jgi:hypothetical protein
MTKDSVGYMVAGYIVVLVLYATYITYLFGQKRKWERGGDDVDAG